MDDVHLGTSSIYSPYGTIGTTNYPLTAQIPNESIYARNYGPILPGPLMT